MEEYSIIRVVELKLSMWDVKCFINRKAQEQVLGAALLTVFLFEFLRNALKSYFMVFAC